MQFTQFQTATVRDLAWVFHSPSLLDPGDQEYRFPPEFKAIASRLREQCLTGENLPNNLVIDDSWCHAQFDRHKDCLLRLDNNSSEFIKWLQERHDPRLGYYFEALVEYWLTRLFPRDRLIPHLQVKDEQRTLGEFDFLRVDNTNRVVHHWEVAVKFYLQHRGRDNSETWYGPNPRDRLDKKLHHLFQHQIKLSLQPQAARVFRELGLHYPVLPQVLLKGYLFYPAHDNWGRQSSRFQALSSQHLRGWWSYIEPFEIPRLSSESRWLYLPRLNWLAPAIVKPEMENKLMNYKQLHSFCLKNIRAKKGPPLVAEVQLTTAGFWQEVSRGIIVPQNWPYFGSDKERFRNEGSDLRRFRI